MRLLEALPDEDSVLIEDEAAGVGDSAMSFFDLSVVRRALFVERDIENAELGNNRASFVAEKWIGNAVRFGEAGQRGHRVVAQGIDRNIIVITVGSLQLDQLRSAPWSPIGAAMDDEQCSSPGSMLVKIDWIARLIRQHNIGEPLAHDWAKRVGIDFGNR